MKRLLCAAFALLVTDVARAETVASWIHGSVGAAWREPSDDPPFDQLNLEYDTGTVLHADVASHYPYGLMLRLSYTYTLYDEFTALGGLTITEDIEQHDARAGAFFAPWRRGGLGWRVGGGYVYAQEDSDEPDQERTQDGGFVEAGITFDAGELVTFDVAAAGMKLEGEDDYDAEGTELRALAAFHTGPVDVTLGGRYLTLQRENPLDEEVFELVLGLGGSWGYREGR
jgi:hypothetical protein